MKMRTLVRLTYALILSTAVAAQGPPPAGQDYELHLQGQDVELRLQGQLDTVRVALDSMAGALPLGPVVRGAPYSAEGVTTTNQTLGDGTRISRTVTARLYRDSQGRTRREQVVLGLDGLDPAAGGEPTVTITDPVAGVSYVLDPATKTARRTPSPAVILKELKIDEAALRARGGAGGRGAPPEGGMARRGGPPPDAGAPPPGGRGMRGGPPPEGMPGARGRVGGPPPGGSAPESLGTKAIEGVEAVGTRVVRTIPVGQIGNDRPIEISDERWMCSELKVLVSSTHHDPRTGDVEYRLTNIRRDEPPADLFTVPSDYAVVNGADWARRIPR